MAVYVDPIREYPTAAIQPAARRYGSHWCHMTADSEAELLVFADRLGLRRSWYQRRSQIWLSHFDLTPAFRAKAIRMGAVVTTSLEAMRRTKATFEAAMVIESICINEEPAG